MNIKNVNDMIWLDEEKSQVIVFYEDDFGNKEEILSMTNNHDSTQKLIYKHLIKTYKSKKTLIAAIDSFSKKNTDQIDYHNKIIKQLQSDEYILHPKNQAHELLVLDNEKILEQLEKVTPDHLFALKIAMFEKECVQESENRELRANIRKATSAIEALHYYYLIAQDANHS